MTQTQQRTAVLANLAATVAALHPSRVIRVGVDGVDGAGKTTFADELATAIAPWGRPTIRAGVDGFHHPRSIRHRRGRDSPEGFFHDSYDYPRLCAMLLDPLGPAGHRRYCTSAFDHDADRPVPPTWADAPADAILIVDGIFLHRPELRAYWDYSLPRRRLHRVGRAGRRTGWPGPGPGPRPTGAMSMANSATSIGAGPATSRRS